MRNKTPNGLLMGVLAVALLLPDPASLGNDLEKLKLPIFDNRDGYLLAVFEYEASSKADLRENEPTEHTIGLKAMLAPPEDEDVLCFRTTLDGVSARDDRRRELILPGKKRNNKGNKFVAVLPREKYRDRKGKPMWLGWSELDDVELERPGYEVQTLTLEATAVIVEERESGTVPAIVADRYEDIGNDTLVQVTLMEVTNKGEMAVKLNVKRPKGDRAAIIDAVYALSADGDEVGGGRWTNELELFADMYEVELKFPLNGRETISRLRVDLATEYKVEPVKIEIEDLYKK